LTAKVVSEIDGIFSFCFHLRLLDTLPGMICMPGNDFDEVARPCACHVEENTS
jgi:hypothetical protein